MSPKVRLVAFWVATAIFIAESFTGAGWDLLRIQYVRDTFDHLGLPYYLLTILGVWKLLGAVAIVVPGFPRLKEWAYAGMVLAYSGAAFCHMAVGDGPDAWTMPLFFALLSLVSWALRPPSYRTARSARHHGLRATPPTKV
ncbi:DoxX family protein [Nonomuraea sp. CA-141351]|uniref:DoxX family protein n=1 Tax=Nonomuraea sp. CA-141351 TaxID=3239996 RepID=UPI003D8D1D10